MIRTLLVLVLLVGPVHAADPDPVGLEQGEAAPYRGVLVTPARARELALAEIERDEARARFALSEAERATDRTEAAAVLAACEAGFRACQVSRAPPPRVVPWYERPAVVFVGGVLVGAGLTVLVVEAVR